MWKVLNPSTPPRASPTLRQRRLLSDCAFECWERRVTRLTVTVTGTVSALAGSRETEHTVVENASVGIAGVGVCVLQVGPYPTAGPCPTVGPPIPEVREPNSTAGLLTRLRSVPLTGLWISHIQLLEQQLASRFQYGP